MRAGFALLIVLVVGGCASVPRAVSRSPARGVQAPLTSAGCVDLSRHSWTDISVTGEAVAASTPDIIGRDYGLTIEPIGEEICVYTGPKVPTPRARYVHVVVGDTKRALVRKLWGALGYKVTVQGKASRAETQTGAGLVLRANWIRVEGYSGSSRPGDVPIAEETYGAAARHCRSTKVIRMRPGVPNVFNVSGLVDRLGAAAGEAEAKRIECVRQYLGIPSKDVMIVYS